MQITGSCHCGAVRFTATIDPDEVKACHCTDCQILSGAPLRGVVTVPIDRFALTGEVKSYVKVADSGNRRAQVFCPACGTPLYGAAETNPTGVAIRLGCIDQRAELMPKLQIWSGSAVPWLSGLAAIPQRQGQ